MSSGIYEFKNKLNQHLCTLSVGNEEGTSCTAHNFIIECSRGSLDRTSDPTPALLSISDIQELIPSSLIQVLFMPYNRRLWT